MNFTHQYKYNCRPRKSQLHSDLCSVDKAVVPFIVICNRLCHGMMVVSLVGSCIALFGLNCWLAGRSGACKAADISTSLINIYTIVDMVSKKYTATVFFGHKWLTR